MSRQPEEVVVRVKGEETASDAFGEVMRGAQAMSVSVKRSSRQMEQSMDGVNRKSQQAGKDIENAGRKFDAVVRGARAAERAVESLGRAVSAYNAKMEATNGRLMQAGGWLGQTALYGGAIGYAGAGAFAASSVNKSATFAQQFGFTQGAIRSNYTDMAKFDADSSKLKSQAKILGSDTTNHYTSVEISAAHEALAKAGLADQSGVDKVLQATPTMLSFAAANKLGIDQSATIASDTGFMFNIGSDGWGGMLDKMTKTADISTIDVPDIVETMKYAGPMAAGLEIGYEDVLGLTAVLGNKGIKGSMAGTGIQAYYARLLNPKDVEKGPSEHAMQVYDQFAKSVVKDGKAVSTVDQIRLLQQSFDKLNQREKSWMATQLFGMEQMKAGFALVEAGANGVGKAIRDIEENSKGINKIKEELALANQYGDLKALEKSVQAIQERIGDDLEPVVRETANQLRAFLNGEGIDFNKLYESFDKAHEKLKELNPDLADAVSMAGKFGIGTIQVGGVLAPVAGGFGKGLIELLNGNPLDAAAEVFKGIAESSDRIEALPEDLQALGSAARNAAIAVAALAAVNFTMKSIETIGSAVGFGRKLIMGTGGGGDDEEDGGDDGIVSDEVTVYGNVVKVYGSGGDSDDLDIDGKRGPKGGGGGTKPSTPSTPKGKLGKAVDAGRKAVQFARERGLWGVGSSAVKALYGGPQAAITVPLTVAAGGGFIANQMDTEAAADRKAAGLTGWEALQNSNMHPEGVDPIKGIEIMEGWRRQTDKVMEILMSAHQNSTTDEQRQDIAQINDELLKAATANMQRGNENIIKGTDVNGLLDYVNKTLGLEKVLEGKRLGDLGAGSTPTVEQEKFFMRAMSQIDKAVASKDEKNIKISADPSTIRLLVEVAGDRDDVRIVEQRIDVGQLEVEVGRQNRRYGHALPLE